MKRTYLILVSLAMMAGQSFAITPMTPRDTPAVKGAVVVSGSVRMASVTSAATPWGLYELAAATRAVEGYFNTLTTLQAEFSQTTTGERWGQEGTLYVKRPGKFIFDYETPTKQRVISTGTAMYYVDEKGVVTQLPRDAGVAKLLGAKKVDLSAMGAKVTRARATRDWLEVTLTLVPTARDNAGLKTLVLGFERGRGGLVLRELAGTDVTGVTMTMTLNNVRTGVVLGERMFRFEPGGN